LGHLTREYEFNYGKPFSKPMLNVVGDGNDLVLSELSIGAQKVPKHVKAILTKLCVLIQNFN
jgi:hypothetical protein